MLALTLGGLAAQSPATTPTLPETFTASRAGGRCCQHHLGSGQVRIDRYIVDYAEDAIRNGLKHGGYSGFLTALRSAPAVGSVTVGDQSFTLRWATQEAIPSGRRIVVITDKPIAFVGGAAAKGAKPRAGYEVALIRFEVDKQGQGQGEMAAAARVRPGGDTGVQIDDYAETMIKLTKVTKGTDAEGAGTHAEGAGTDAEGAGTYAEGALRLLSVVLLWPSAGLRSEWLAA